MTEDMLHIFYSTHHTESKGLKSAVSVLIFIISASCKSLCVVLPILSHAGLAFADIRYSVFCLFPHLWLYLSL